MMTEWGGGGGGAEMGDNDEREKHQFFLVLALVTTPEISLPLPITCKETVAHFERYLPELTISFLLSFIQ